MKLCVTLSANAGVAINFGGFRIWVDALHNRKVLGFSPVTDALLGELWEHEAFQKPDIICYTHRHPDHYSRDLTLQAAQRWPSAKMIAPDVKETGWMSVTGERWEYRLDGLTVTYVRLPHEGAEFADTVHYGILLTCEGKTVLIPGDCKLCDPALAAAVAGKKLFAVLLDFPWITLPKPRAFVENVLTPEYTIVYHLPFEADDVNGYRAAAQKAAQRMENRVQLLSEPFQKIEI